MTMKLSSCAGAYSFGWNSGRGSAGACRQHLRVAPDGMPTSTRASSPTPWNSPTSEVVPPDWELVFELTRGPMSAEMSDDQQQKVTLSRPR